MNIDSATEATIEHLRSRVKELESELLDWQCKHAILDNMTLTGQALRENIKLKETLKEAREQLGWLNEEKVHASTNIVLKDIDKVLK